MRLNRKTKLYIVTGIALSMILYGVLNKIFQFNVSPNIVSKINLVAMILAFALLFSKNDIPSKPQQNDGQKNEEADTAAQNAESLSDKPDTAETESKSDDTN